MDLFVPVSWVSASIAFGFGLSKFKFRSMPVIALFVVTIVLHSIPYVANRNNDALWAVGVFFLTEYSLVLISAAFFIGYVLQRLFIRP